MKYMSFAVSICFLAASISASAQTLERSGTSTPSLQRIQKPTLGTVPRGTPGRVTHPLQPPKDISSAPVVRSSIQVPLVDLPYQAQDLPAGGRLYRGKRTHSGAGVAWQQFAYDIGVAVPDKDGKFWDFKPTINWKKPRNSDFYIHGVPIRAMSDGVVTHCWRNAPQNPRPFTAELDSTAPNLPLAQQTWLHVDTRLGKVFGSGNFVVVKEDAGTVIHYAHGQPGTVPKHLCPHEGRLLNPSTWMADSEVPLARQKRVRRGDILMRTGNSGTSSAPHIHFERTEANLLTSVRLRFRNGLTARLEGGTSSKRATGNYRALNGNSLPAGPIIIWPARGPGGLWSWHRQRTNNFNEAFLHMADSGYIPRWLDFYRASGKTRVAAIWTPAKAGWVAHTGRTGAQFQKDFDKAVKAGFFPIRMDSHTTSAGVRYSAVFSKDASPDFIARHGQTGASFDKEFKTLPAKGYVLTSASVVSSKGKRRYTVLWQKVNAGGWVFLPAIRGRDYQAVFNKQAKAKRFPSTFSAYRHKGRTYYAVVFTQRPGRNRKDRHGMTDAKYQSEFANPGSGTLKAVSGVDGHGQFRYIATWR